MSTYSPTTWVNNLDPAINADNLNKLEAGVSSAHIEIEQLVDGTTKAGKAVMADHAITVDLATQFEVGGARIWVDSTDPANIIGHIDAR